MTERNRPLRNPPPFHAARRRGVKILRWGRREKWRRRRRRRRIFTS
jgi:hypothetical protein